MGFNIGSLVGKAARWVARQAEQEAQKEIEKDLGQLSQGAGAATVGPIDQPGQSPEGPASRLPPRGV